ncbi:MULTISPECIES: GNAT family N-acetyltransferase [Haloferax]|uniref:GNAT family N-acetyltransferase n=2 Tax=Haloferax TaxID=2251 RepID=A0A6G1Z6U7_9EURY|nr:MULTISPECIES: GNAT family N-acetyltransferase [Haloferax]KAB1185099.1 GNAT family N-acetyltransferase [Haloferax sp. CBA1149]MRW82276.1 GNAT family N-acetyltransferase [Haloferax marinisediminis]
MTIEIEAFDRSRRDEWDRYVERSGDASIFHQYRALELQAKHSNSTLHPLVGFKNEQAIGLYPVFEIRKGPVKTAFSPPPNLGVPYLGPVLLGGSGIKQRKLERRRNQFIEGCTNWVNNNIDPTYTHVRVGDYYTDMRIFQWGGCTVTPKYTYNVDLDRSEEDLLLSFSRSARRNIRDGEDVASNISIGGREDLEAILALVEDRYDEQDLAFDIPSAFVRGLYDELPDGQVQPYVFKTDGEFVSGIIVLNYGKTTYRWLGGARPKGDYRVDVNDLLDWRIMCDAKDAGRVRYDLVGANNRRLNRYKGKYNPELVTFYQIEHGPLPIRAAAHLYKSSIGSGISALAGSNRSSMPARLVSGIVPMITTTYRSESLPGDTVSGEQ